MNSTCHKCNRPNPPGAVFCSGCGQPLAGTTQGHTVLMSAAPATLSHTQQRAIAQRVSRTFGGQTMPIVPGMLAPGQPGQRELLFPVEDVSGSMAEQYDAVSLKIQAMIQACIGLILEKARTDLDDEVGLITFNDTAMLRMPLSPLRSHKRKLIQSVQSLTADGGTDINAGLVMARDNFTWQRKDVVRRIVLLTDGHGGDPRAVAEELKSRGVVIDVFGIGPTPSDINEDLLRSLASNVGGARRYFFVRDRQTLLNTYPTLGGKTSLG